MRLPRPFPHAPALWAGIIGGGALLDWYLDRGEPDHDTASECIRSWFHTDTAAGKVAFSLALAGGTAWLHGHILKEIG